MPNNKEKFKQEIYNDLFRIETRNEVISSERDKISGELTDEGIRLSMLSYADSKTIRDKLRRYNQLNNNYFKKAEDELNNKIKALEKELEESEY